MSRFANLEFDDRAPGRPERGKAAESGGAPIRDAAYFHREAEKSFLAGDFEAALRSYSRMLEHNSALFEGWFGQVRMLIELDEYEEALVWADKALELFPDHPALLAAKSAAANRAGRIEKAMTHSDDAVSKKNAGPYVWVARAEVLFARNSRMAEHCLSNAVTAAGAAAPRVRLDVGRVLLQAGRALKALEYLKAAVSALPTSALAWLELGRCQGALGLPEAETSLAQCLELRPGWPPATNALKHLEKRGLFGGARARLRRLFGR